MPRKHFQTKTDSKSPILKLNITIIKKKKHSTVKDIAIFITIYLVLTDR